MNFENLQNKEADILWTARANSFKTKIDREIDSYITSHGDDGGHVLQRLNRLNEMIGELFSNYERKNMSISQVENDIRYRIDRGEDETEEKDMYKQILAMLQLRTGPLF